MHEVSTSHSTHARSVHVRGDAGGCLPMKEDERKDKIRHGGHLGGMKLLYAREDVLDTWFYILVPS